MASKVTEGYVRILLFVFFWATFSPFADATIAEGTALAKMMESWGTNFSGWRSGVDPCAAGQTWQFVKCRNESVVSLNVTSTGIQGSLPSDIGELKKLEVLDVSNFDEFNSTIHNVSWPLASNNLSGPFPDTLAQCTQLMSLNGTNVLWNIPFPSVISRLTALSELQFAGANFSGSIPDSLFKLTKMRYFFLGGNDRMSVAGSLRKFSNLTNLVILTLSKGGFNERIPDELASLTKLEYFNCHTCGLYGPLPDSFSNLTKLQNLTLHRNQFTGQFPESWKSLIAMKNIRVDQNYLSGPFPAWVFGTWRGLEFLRLERNSLYGPAPNIVMLDQQYNVSERFDSLKWSCNYLNGTNACVDSDNCQGGSNQLRQEAEDHDNFDFRYNCYEGTSPNDFSKVATECSVYHPRDVLCDGFYQVISKEDGCPGCPPGQVPWPDASSGGGKCVCQPGGPSGGSSGVSAGAVAGAVVGIVVVFLVIIALILYKRRKQFAFLDIFTVHKPKESEYWEIPAGLERFSLQDLSKVTQDFSDSNMIGQGGFGKVFVGTLADGRMVAIKRATAGGMQGDAEFRNEVTLLSRLHHRHLVKLEGFCDEGGLQILIYEFMKKGNLHDHLLNKRTTTLLTWYQRLEIAYGVAQGLEYLHSFANPPVIHRDVKPSNILLNEHMVAKLADFGISKVNPEFDTHLSTRPAGTAGYLDPDYFMRRQLTSASDVYAFGVVLLELVTGQEAIDHTRLDEFNLIEWVKKRFKTRGIISIVDPLIEGDYNTAAFSEMAKLGLTCASFDRAERPNMQECLATLQPFMVRLTPTHDGKDKDRQVSFASFETEDKLESMLLDRTSRSSTSDHTNRSNSSEVGSNTALMSRNLAPR